MPTEPQPVTFSQRLAARAEFHGKPPAHVERWLEQRGIEV